VLNDADLDEAVKAAVTGRYQNSGQVCAASKRFILEAGIAEAFTRKFVDAVAALKMGDPRDEQNYVGPMARFDLRDELHQQVTATLDEGATLLLGAENRRGGQLLCANGAGQRHRRDDRLSSGAVWSGSNPDHRSRR
jgi:succinate-semialdehyde dehydrogenase